MLGWPARLEARMQRVVNPELDSTFRLFVNYLAHAGTRLRAAGMAE